MDAQQKTIAQKCLEGAYDNTMSFPEGVQALMEAGFDGYHVDYRLNTRTYYLPNGETLVLSNPDHHSAMPRSSGRSSIRLITITSTLTPG
jgi:hypothetical protein